MVGISFDLDDLDDPPRRSRGPLETMHCLPDLRHHLLWLLEDLVLPDSAHTPAQCPKATRLNHIPLRIRSELVGPQSCRAPGPNVVVGTTMPEASIDEDGHHWAREDEVRPADGSPSVDTVTEALCPEQTPQNPLGLRVLPPDARHLFRAAEPHALSLSAK